MKLITHEVNGDKIRMAKFHSIHEALDVANKSKLVLPDDKKWVYGKMDKKTYAKKIKSGMSDVPRQYKELQKRIGKKINPTIFAQRGLSCKRTRRFADIGEELSIDRVMAGSDIYFEDIKRDRNKANVRLAVGVSTNCGISPDDMNNLAIQLAVMANTIFTLGYSVEIYSSSFNTYLGTEDYDYTNSLIRIKSPHEKLNIRRIFTLGYSGFARDTDIKISYETLDYSRNYMGIATNHPKDYKKVIGVDYILERGLNNDVYEDSLTKLIAGLS